ncbi:MAG TPA: hypothetical protein VMY37_01515 [Thermoguttaceae bacterium]|nr:hypothetical protein [Thermoguttaceae bacterium]
MRISSLRPPKLHGTTDRGSGAKWGPTRIARLHGGQPRHTPIIADFPAFGTINHTLQTLIAAAAFREGLPIAGIVLNNPAPSVGDRSTASNRRELAGRAVPPILAEVAWQAEGFDAEVDWRELAAN